MDYQMATVMTNHATILSTQEYISQQLQHQHDCTEAMKREIEEMKAVVHQVRELLSALKGISLIAKWTTIVGAGFAAFWHGLKWAWKLL